MVRRRVLAVRVLGPVVLAVAVVLGSVAPASATPATVPAPVPVQRLAAAAGKPLAHVPAAAPERRALKLVGDDDETYLEILPACAVGKAKAKVTAVLVTSTKVKLDYVLTGAGVRKTGTVKTKADREVSVKLPSVRQGAYRLTLTLHGRTDLVGDEAFDVLPCVTAKTSCRAVTFTNPLADATAFVVYSGHKRSQPFDLELAPGESRTVRADYSKIDFDAVTDDDDFRSLGDGTVKVKQKCTHGPAQPTDHAVQTAALVGCSGSGAGTVTLGWSAQPSVTKRRYEVLGAQDQVVAQGSFKGGHDTDLSLPAGSFTYRSYANGLAQPFEDVTFDVLACVQVTPRCQAFDVENPNAVPVVVLTLDTGDDPGEDEDLDPVTLAGHASTTIAWHTPAVWVVALPESEWSGSGSAFFSIASPWQFDDDAPEDIAVPQNC